MADPVGSVANFIPILHHDTYPYISPVSVPSLANKHIFITGASKGVGRALALSYARAGASSLVLTARSSLDSLATSIASVAKEAGHPVPKVFSYAMDVENRSAIERVAKSIEKDLDGRLDILVNNAGYLESWKPIADGDPDEWWKSWTVNMRGPYLVSRALLPLLLRGGDKTIVNVSSVGAHTTMPGASAYQMAKFAVCRFTEVLVAEDGSQGLLAFAVHPGAILTELAGKMPSQFHYMLDDKVELAGDTIMFLTANRQERQWLAGRYISCNWDMKSFLGKKDEIVEKDLLKFRMVI
ncbi:hypothetical protein MMC13_000381 [Lambiella insularis]|nr:hypothetical protein [Lambiella insularis]